MESPGMAELIAKSKYKQFEGFGGWKVGHISLQDHGNDVWFRNLLIRRFPAE